MKDMILYKDNPHIAKLQVVETIDGTKEYRRNTKYINSKYHTINKDCFQINENWYSIDGGNIIFDWEIKEWILSKYAKNVIRGLVKDEKGNLILGYFSPNYYNNVYTYSNEFGKIKAINLEILGSDWQEDKGTNMWFNIKDYTSSSVNARKQIRNEKGYTNRGYNIEENSDYEFKIDLYKKFPTIISEKAQEMSKYLGDLTFGIEYELSQGDLPDFLKNRLGIVTCRDGSLNGGAEEVSIPLSGAKGLQTTVDTCKALQERSRIDLNCSMHIHFGNFKTDKLTIIALYMLCRNIQNEIFSMFPYYKIAYHGIKTKNYTKKLLKLNINTLKDTSEEAYECFILDSWKKLFDFYVEGKISLDQFNEKTRKHPIEHKWNRHNRYYYFNMLNLFFGHRHTCEARLHSGSTNPHKVINWLFICAAIIKYAEKFSMEIITKNKTISFKEVLDIYPTLYPNDPKAFFISKYLYEYFLQRQARCKKDLEKNDYISAWDIEEDYKYEFEFQGVKGLI